MYSSRIVFCCSFQLSPQCGVYRKGAGIAVGLVSSRPSFLPNFLSQSHRMLCIFRTLCNCCHSATLPTSALNTYFLCALLWQRTMGGFAMVIMDISMVFCFQSQSFVSFRLLAFSVNSASFWPHFFFSRLSLITRKEQCRQSFINYVK